MKSVLVAVSLASSIALFACNSEVPTSPADNLGRGLTASGGPGVEPMTLPNTYDLDSDGLADTAEETLVRRYRPYFYFDGQEFILPISIEQWANIGGRLYRDFDSYYPYATLTGLYNNVLSAPWGSMSPNFLTPGIRDNYGPLYVDAIPMRASYTLNGKSNLVWLHFWLFFSYDVKVSGSSFQHEGDWEHVCVMVERGAIDNPNLAPVMIHWHHHGGVTVSSTAYANHSDTWGTKHPRAYIEAGSHGIYRAPGTGGGGGSADDNAGSSVNPLSRELRFMTTHWMNRYGGPPGVEKDILQSFDGHWGADGYPGEGPKNPLQWASAADHDYTPIPGSTSFRVTSYTKYPWDSAH